MSGLVTRDSDVARRMGLSPGIVREVARLAAQAVASRAGAAPASRNPWLSQANPAFTRGPDYAEVLLDMARRSSRSDPTAGMGGSTALEIAQFALSFSMSGALGLLGAALLQRELQGIVAGGPGVTGMSRILGGVSGPAQFIVPGEWDKWGPEDNWYCVGAYSYVSMTPLLNHIGDCTGASWPALGYEIMPLATYHQTYDLQPNTSAYLMEQIGTWSEGAIYARGDRYVYTGQAVPAPVSPEVLPHWGEPAAVVTGISVAGLAAPISTPLRHALEQGRALGLPGLGLPSVGVHPATMEAVHAAREALGLRETGEGIPLPQAKPVASTSSVGWTQLAPGIHAETEGKAWKMTPERHVYARDKVKTKKLKVSGKAWLVYGFLMGVFTETNDLVESIWEALPRSCRTAGKTRSGNRRTDRMLQDLYRCWDRVDWNAATTNIVKNEVEDAIIGRVNRFLNDLSKASGQGLGTTYGKLTDGMLTKPIVDWATGVVESHLPPALRRVEQATGVQPWHIAAGAAGLVGVGLTRGAVRAVRRIGRG